MPSTRYVFDSFAFFALVQEEPGAPIVEKILTRAQHGEAHVAMTVVNAGEAVYKTLREYGQEQANRLIARLYALPISLLDVDMTLALSAALLKGQFKMSYADCFAAALAQALPAVLLTGDPEFKQVQHLISVEWLPQP